ncbi:MAG: hypothetical protein ACTSV1_05045 [Alphaproteobacteria bacterium]
MTLNSLPAPVSILWLAAKVVFFLLLSLSSVDVVVVAYQQF